MFDPCAGLPSVSPCPGVSPSLPVLVSPRLPLSWSPPYLPVLVSPCLSLSWSPPSLPVLVSPCICPGLTLSLASGSRLSGRLGRSESLRVSDRRRPSRGSLGAKGRGGGRSRSDVDMDPSSATAVLGPTRRATYVTAPPFHPPRQPGESGRLGWGISDTEVTVGLQWSQERGEWLLSRDLGAGPQLGPP